MTVGSQVQAAGSWIMGHRKFAVWLISVIIVLLNKKLGLNLSDTDVQHLLAAITGGFMIGNGLEHIGAGLAGTTPGNPPTTQVTAKSEDKLVIPNTPPTT